MQRKGCPLSQSNLFISGCKEEKEKDPFGLKMLNSAHKHYAFFHKIAQVLTFFACEDDSHLIVDPC